MIRRHEVVDDGSGGDDKEAKLNQTGLMRRADTMFQDRYDFLSERKKKEYTLWKAGVLRRIKNLETGEDGMDIDS